MSTDGKIYYEEIQIVGDGRGTMQGDYLLNKDRPIDRIRWLLECFPEWGRFLNRQIEETVVEKGTYALWWTGGMGFVLKSPGGAVLLVDNYAGPAHYTEYAYCGDAARPALRRSIGSGSTRRSSTSSASRPDGVFCSHQHADHTGHLHAEGHPDFRLPFYDRCRGRAHAQFQVPEERIRSSAGAGVTRSRTSSVEILPNYDRIATMTGGPGVKSSRRAPAVRRRGCHVLLQDRRLQLLPSGGLALPERTLRSRSTRSTS
jgi:L-ascorbate 6-phosphate lactonase